MSFDFDVMAKKSKLGLKLTTTHLLICFIHRKRKSVTKSSDDVTKIRRIEIEADSETDGNIQRKKSKITMLRDAIEEAHIELRQSIRDAMDSLSSDIDGKGRKLTLWLVLVIKKLL